MLAYIPLHFRRILFFGVRLFLCFCDLCDWLPYGVKIYQKLHYSFSIRLDLLSFCSCLDSPVFLSLKISHSSVTVILTFKRFCVALSHGTLCKKIPCQKTTASDNVPFPVLEKTLRDLQPNCADQACWSEETSVWDYNRFPASYLAFFGCVGDRGGILIHFLVEKLSKSPFDCFSFLLILN